ncbi:MAG TPA: hypothetical protein VD906_13985 [Caulobacteraceae bacterium]|nr:hypothetical protein [Caulobacteraceae bacterium]
MRIASMTAAALLALATPTLALAQAGNTAGLVDLPGVAPAETSPLKRLPKKARSWISAEKARFAASPRPLEALVFDIQYELEKEILKTAERERLDTHDLITVMLFDITSGASEILAGEMRALERAGGPDADRAALAARKKAVDEMAAEVVRGQSVLARQLSGNL